MERLRQSELESVLAFVGECYSFCNSESGNSEPFTDFVPQLAAACLRLIPTVHVTYNEMIPERSESRNYVTTPEIDTPEMNRLWELHMHEQPVLAHILKTGERRAMRISEFCSQREFHRKGLYYDFYRLAEIEDSLCISVPAPPPRFIGLAWHGGRAFTDRERLIADLVRPHIGQAWRNARLMVRMQNQVHMLGEGMESLGAGVILCGAHGRVDFINAAARQHLAEYLGVKRQTDHRLPDDVLLWVRSQELPRNRIDDAPPLRAPLIYDRGTKRLEMRLLSRPGGHLIVMEERRTAPGDDLAALGLTAREAEVLSWIARGKTNREIAIILEMRPATVRKHVEHILMKLGVETRTAAAAMALGNNGHAGIG